MNIKIDSEKLKSELAHERILQDITNEDLKESSVMILDGEIMYNEQAYALFISYSEKYEQLINNCKI